MRSRLVALVALAAPLLAISLAGCAKPIVQPRYAPGVGEPPSITVTSRAFTEGTRIPVDNTCDGTDVMPELVLSAPPENTKSLVVYLEDPDALGGPFTHLVAFDLAPEVHKVPSAPDLGAAGEAARFGVNDFGGVRYQGPCPPKGEVHRYRFHVLAVDKMLKLPEGSPRAKVDAAIDGHILGEGSLTGHFGH